MDINRDKASTMHNNVNGTKLYFFVWRFMILWGQARADDVGRDILFVLGHKKTMINDILGLSAFSREKQNVFMSQW